MKNYSNTTELTNKMEMEPTDNIVKTKEDELSEKLTNNMQTSDLDIDCLPPFLSEYLILATSVCNASPKALAEAWLPFIAVSIGSKVYIKNELKKVFPNLWVGLIGASGQSRKSTAVNVAKHTMKPFLDKLSVMKEMDKQKVNPIINRVTLTKLESLLQDNNSRIIVLEELSSLKEMFTNKNNKGMKQELTAIYDGDSSYTSMNNTIDIKDCSLSMLFCSTPESVQSIFNTEEDRQFGFAQRIFPCIISTENNDNDISLSSNDESDDKLEQLDDKLDILRNIPGSYELKLSSEARDYYQDKVNNIKKFIEQTDGSDAWSYGIRIYIQGFLKFCIIFTLMENLEELKIAINENKCEDFFNSLQVSVKKTEQTLFLCSVIYKDMRTFMNLVNASKLTNERKIAKQLARYPNQWVTKSLILQNTGINSDYTNKAFDTLYDQEVVNRMKIKLDGAYKITECYMLLPGGWEIYKLPDKPKNCTDIYSAPVITPHGKVGKYKIEQSKLKKPL